MTIVQTKQNKKLRHKQQSSLPHIMPDPDDLQKEIFGDSDEELSEEEGEAMPQD